MPISRRRFPISFQIPCRALFLMALSLVSLAQPQAAYPQAARGSRRRVSRPAPLQVDLETSRVYIKVSSTTRFGHDHGVEGRLAAGTIDLGGAGELVFDMNSFITDTPAARRYVGLKGAVSRSDQQKTTAEMLGALVLDVAHYPKASFTIASAAPLDGQAPGDPGRYQLEGQFSLHGVPQRLQLTALVERIEGSNALRMRGAFAIRQTSYGITPYSAIGGIVGVTDKLDIWGEIVFRPSL